MAVSTANLITPHPSPRRHLPLKLRRGRQKAKPLLRIAILTAQVDATNGTDKSVPYKVRPKTQHCTTGSRSSYGLFQCPEPGHRKTQQRTNVTRGTHGFLRSLDTGQPQNSASHQRSAKRYGFHHCLDTGLPEIYLSVGASNRL